MLIAEQGQAQGSGFEVFKAFADTLRDTCIEDRPISVIHTMFQSSVRLTDNISQT